MNSTHKPRWFIALGVICVSFVCWQFAGGFPNPPCNPAGCDAWNCVTGSVNNPGTLSVTNVTVCTGSAVSSSVSGTTFNNGSKSRLCHDTCANTTTDGPHPVTSVETN